MVSKPAKPKVQPLPAESPADIAEKANLQRQKFNAPGARGRADTILTGGLGLGGSSPSTVNSILGITGR